MKKIQIHKIICFCVIVFPHLLKAQIDHQNRVKDTLDVTYKVYSHFSDIRLEEEQNSLKIIFDTITKNQFNSFKAKYTSRIDTNTNRISVGENSFQLTVADTVFNFGCEHPRPCHNYHGYYPDLDSYLIGALGDGIYETFLIDNNTARGLPIPAFFDGSGYNPLISPDKKLMLIYGTCPDPKYCLKYYPYVSVMALVDISNTNQLKDLKTYKFFETKDWVIVELVWIDGNKIALKVCDEYRHNEPVNEKYLKAEIKNTGANNK